MEGNGIANVFSPTTYGTVLIRWLINATNLEDVHKYQAQTSVSTIARQDNRGAPSLVSLNIDQYKNLTAAERVLSLLAAFAPWNMPETETAAEAIAPRLRAAGISNGSFSLPEGVDVAAANRTALAAVAAEGTSPSSKQVENNGWFIVPEGLAGNFDNGTNYAFRTAIAAIGYLMLQAPLAVYPTWNNASDPAQASTGGAFTLDQDEALVYTFSGKPPLMATGFWSLTAYGPDNYLVPNELGRYALGDRSNLTYSDGTPVYAPGSSSREESFQIIIQAADNPPPSNWTSNWVPGPAGGGDMFAILRWYNAETDLLDGTYRYPVVTRRAAITAARDGATSNGSGGSSAANRTSTTATTGMMPSGEPSTGDARVGKSVEANSVVLMLLTIVIVLA